MDDQGSESVFNEAALKMRRIHSSQELVNSLQVNLLMFNNIAGKYNYEIVLTEYLNLLNEVWGKLSAPEKKEARRWRNLLINILEFMPVYETKSISGISGEKKIKQINNNNWNETKQFIFDFGLLVREYLEKHGLSGDNKMSDGGWD